MSVRYALVVVVAVVVNYKAYFLLGLGTDAFKGVLASTSTSLPASPSFE